MIRFAVLMSLILALVACEKKPKVMVMQEQPAEEQEESGSKTEEQLREEYEKKIEARENAPEPELDPNDPREKFELVWRGGKTKLQSIYNERNEVISMLRRLKLEDKKEAKVVKSLLVPMTEFGIGRSAEEMETAPKELCAMIERLRKPSDKLILPGTAELKKLKELEESYEEREAKRLETCEGACLAKSPAKWVKPFLTGAGAAARATCAEAAKEAGQSESAAGCRKQEIDGCANACLAEADDKQAGPAVYQKDWDKLEEERKRWSKPVRAGKQILLVVRTMLDEGMVLAEYGPRRAQIGLRDCLTEVSKEPLLLDLAQEVLEKVIKRAKWYRE
ncbi:MAG: hypothetical protein VX938_09180 [Myxococcota bacterium]|nr:hypothetical protein [Myxococcota bacterium]